MRLLIVPGTVFKLEHVQNPIKQTVKIERLLGKSVRFVFTCLEMLLFWKESHQPYCQCQV